MSATSIMKNIASLITTVFMIALINVAVSLSCSSYGCYHWVNMFNHDLVCHGCINVMKYMKDFQMMMYVSFGLLLIKEIKGLIDSVNDKFYDWCEGEDKTDEKVTECPPTDDVTTAEEKTTKVNVSNYSLGRNSPRPSWSANMHD
jgi:hypothetical protein